MNEYFHTQRFLYEMFLILFCFDCVRYVPKDKQGMETNYDGRRQGVEVSIFGELLHVPFFSSLA